MFDRRTIRALLPLMVILVAACEGPGSNEGILPAKARYFVADIPVPAKFELDRRKSTHEFGPGRRSIKHFYLGKASPLAVSNFYRQRMPEYQWELIDKQLRNGVEHLNYQKGDESCEIRVEETPGGLFGNKTQISVVISSNQ